MPRRPLLLTVLLFVGLVGCDHATKGAAEARLAGEAPAQVVPGVVELSYHQNHGIAFNLERVLPEGARRVVVPLGILAAMFVVVVAWRRRLDLGAHPVAYALIASGAVGNLIDRVVRGYVVDFIHVTYWPVFNVADVALVVGIGLLFVSRPKAIGARG